MACFVVKPLRSQRGCAAEKGNEAAVNARASRGCASATKRARGGKNTTRGNVGWKIVKGTWCTW
ncbi:MAG TPA: hypothetical protein IAC12_01065 [Candidatus Aphodovivens avistercoris]|nr:hypothetical protein [Candidatus Aphodovivens avistercoris]